jgi:O-antigen chain-terminating methyltransferase
VDGLNFYRAFEDRHRGSREIIKSRLEQYSPFLELLTSNFDKRFALDIGCGRGEWLELLDEKGFAAQGVDLDSGMLASCVERGFDVKEAEGIEYLEGFESNALHLISAFHVVEHISFEQLQNLIKQAYRVLVPGGLLILETPNPENLSVASAGFYLDPTHIKPIPPLLLSFATEFEGFSHNKIVRLQESVELRTKQNISPSELLMGVSPDYSVVAQKLVDNDSSFKFKPVFDNEYGLSLSELSARLDNRLVLMEAKASEAEVKASEAEAKASEVILQRDLVLDSTSWKITAPLRKIMQALVWFKNGILAWFFFKPQSRPRRVLKSILLRLKSIVEQSTSLKKLVFILLKPFPSLSLRLRSIGQENHIHNAQDTKPEVFSDLSPRAKQVYAQLKQAVDQNKKDSI